MTATAAAVLVLLLAAAAPPSAQAAVDQKTCLPYIVGLTPCLPYIQNKASEPSVACCRNLAQVVQGKATCLCAILDGEASQWLGIPVDVSKALSLPPACSVKTPPTSECSGSPSDLSSSAPAGSPILPSPAPSPKNSSGVHSGAGFTKSDLLPCLGLLFAVLCLIGF